MSYDNSVREIRGMMADPAIQLLPPPNPAETVHSLLNDREQQIERLANLVALLEDRLSPVLAPSPPTGESTGHQMQQKSALVEALRIHGYKLDAVASRLSDILNHIEL